MVSLLQNILGAAAEMGLLSRFVFSLPALLNDTNQEKAGSESWSSELSSSPGYWQ